MERKVTIAASSCFNITNNLFTINFRCFLTTPFLVISYNIYILIHVLYFVNYIIINIYYYMCFVIFLILGYHKDSYLEKSHNLIAV